jgi:hypothetical protein
MTDNQELIDYIRSHYEVINEEKIPNTNFIRKLINFINQMNL